MRRFTIGRLMLVVVGSALLLVPLRLVEWSSIHPLLIAQGVALVGGLVGGCAAFWLGRPRPRFARTCFVVARVLWSGTTAAILMYLLSIGGILLLILITLVLAPVTLGAGASWAAERSEGTTRRPRRWLRIVVVLAVLTLPASMMATQWPLQLAFVLSRPAMDRLADRIAAGGTLTAPEWAGCYRIVDIAISPNRMAIPASPKFNNVALVIDASRSGRSGFVRSTVPSDLPPPLTNLDLDLPVGGPWSYQNED